MMGSRRTARSSRNSAVASGESKSVRASRVRDQPRAAIRCCRAAREKNLPHRHGVRQRRIIGQ